MLEARYTQGGREGCEDDGGFLAIDSPGHQKPESHPIYFLSKVGIEKANHEKEVEVYLGLVLIEFKALNCKHETSLSFNTVKELKDPFTPICLFN